jgi:hypothetical protein
MNGPRRERRSPWLPLLAAITVLLWLTPALRAQQPQQRRLDTTTFVVLGEGLAAGMSGFGLHEVSQKMSFPALMAQQMNTAFPQPLFEGPGLQDVLGYPSLPVRFPTVPQGRVRVFPDQANDNDEAPTLFVFNLSVPNFRVGDSLTRKPISPLIHNDDSQQTAINLILGFPAMILERDVPLWTQTEYARAMVPSMALIELGYFEALEAAVARNPALIPDRAAFGASYRQIVQTLRAQQVEVVVTTIPDPMDTAFFSTPASVARLTRVPEALIRDSYSLAANDYVTRNGLTVIGNQFMRRSIQPLPAEFILRNNVGGQITTRVNALNEEIRAIAGSEGAVIYDLAAFFRRVKTQGISVGPTRLTADYFGNFYSLDGYFPGATGHALIANDILAFLNQTYSANFPLLDVTPLLAGDAVAAFRTARDPNPGEVFQLDGVETIYSPPATAETPSEAQFEPAQ